MEVCEEDHYKVSMGQPIIMIVTTVGKERRG
jgi:hypothetical protein